MDKIQTKNESTISKSSMLKEKKERLWIHNDVILGWEMGLNNEILYYMKRPTRNEKKTLR